MPCDEYGRSIGLEHHLHKVVQGSALLPVASSLSTTSGQTLPLPKDAYFTYLGPREEALSIQVREGRKKTRYVVSADALGRTFTLAASHYISMIEARRPAAVPAGAYFDEVDRQWVFGRRHGSIKLGAFQLWRRDGRLSAQLEYREDGIVHGPFVHYHPDGTVACQGRYDSGVLHGTTTYQRCAGATTEKFPQPHQKVWRLEADPDQGRETARRFFSRSGALCDAKGQPR